jgi:hypothetical protein
VPRPDARKAPFFATDGARLGSIFLGMFAIALDQEVSYFIVEWSCGARAHWPSFALSAVALLIALAGVAIAWRDLRALPAGASAADGTADGRNRFLALLGLMLSGFFALAIVFETIAKFFFDPCQR